MDDDSPQFKKADWPKWARGFLKALAITGVVTRAAKAAKTDRTTAYDLRAADPAFALAWKDALAAADDRLEAEAVERAVAGWEEPVVYQGALCWQLVDARGRARTPPQPDAEGKPAPLPKGWKYVPLTVAKKSDTLLIFLLKKRRFEKVLDELEGAIEAAAGPTAVGDAGAGGGELAQALVLLGALLRQRGSPGGGGAAGGGGGAAGGGGDAGPGVAAAGGPGGAAEPPGGGVPESGG